jgi:hypothetical protein
VVLVGLTALNIKGVLVVFVTLPVLAFAMRVVLSLGHFGN